MSRYTFATSTGRFRIVSIAEGISYLLLLGVAMPLKYFADLPEAVKYTGWAHGLLFVLYMLTGLDTAISERWSFKVIVLAFIASLLPFGPFVFDSVYLKEKR